MDLEVGDLLLETLDHIIKLADVAIRVGLVILSVLIRVTARSQIAERRTRVATLEEALRLNVTNLLLKTLSSTFIEATNLPLRLWRIVSHRLIRSLIRFSLGPHLLLIPLPP